MGDASTYLRPDGRGKLSLDKDFYLGSRGMMGDSPALTAFLEQMVDSSLFERFVDMRRAQVWMFLRVTTIPRWHQLYPCP